MQDHFKYKAGNWDKGELRQSTPLSISNAIKEKIRLTKNMDILDFGVGTGLLGFIIANEVKKVYGVDTSPSMLAKLQEKNTTEVHIEAICQDIVQEPLNMTFDGVISSMTLHHVENLEAFFSRIYKNLNEDGFISIADLESEDGSFHSDNKGVFHFGFDKEELCTLVKKCGFRDVECKNITTICKPQKEFGVFLLTARR